MPTIQDIYQMLQQHEDAAKTASIKKEAIASPQRGTGDPASEMGAVLEDVLGPNVAETKVRIKKKLEEVSGAQQALAGVASEANEEAINTTMAPQLGDKMPPTDTPPTAATEAAAVTPPAGSAPAAGAVAAATAAGPTNAAAAGKLSGILQGILQEKTSVADPAVQEKAAEEKAAEQYHAAGQIMAHGFMSELQRLSAGEEKK